MNLQETVEALQRSGIEVALDLGIHQFCLIDCNCPLAVELRRIINSSGVTLPELLTGFAESQEPSLDPLLYELPQFSGKVVLSVAGKNVEMDLSDVLGDQLDRIFAGKVREYTHMEDRLQGVGASLFETYLYNINEAKKARTLPQLHFDIAQLTKYSCLISTDGEKYLFLFPIRYEPQWIYTREVRYQLTERDIISLQKDIYVVFPISKENKILTMYLIERDGNKLQHYHGARGDCWGHVTIPDRWDGTLKSLHYLAYQLQAALATINKDSIMQSNPPGMTHVNELFERSTELGREGVRDTAAPEEVDLPDVEDEDGTPEHPPTGQPMRRAWGGTRRP